MRNTINVYWKNNKVTSYIIVGVVLLILAHFGIFSINITVGPVSLSLGSPY